VESKEELEDGVKIAVVRVAVREQTGIEMWRWRVGDGDGIVAAVPV